MHDENVFEGQEPEGLTQEQSYVVSVAAGALFSAQGLVDMALLKGEISTDEVQEIRQLIDRCGNLMRERHGPQIPNAPALGLRAIKKLLSWVPPDEAAQPQPAKETLQ